MGSCTVRTFTTGALGFWSLMPYPCGENQLRRQWGTRKSDRGQMLTSKEVILHANCPILVRIKPHLRRITPRWLPRKPHNSLYFPHRLVVLIPDVSCLHS